MATQIQHLKNLINNKKCTRLLKFLTTGGLAALVEYAIFITINIALGSAWLIFSQIVSFLCGFIVSFLLNKQWVFKSKHDTKKQLKSYALLAAVNLLLSSGVLWLLVSIFGVVYFVAKVIIMAMVAAWNYVLFSRIIFTNKH